MTPEQKHRHATENFAGGPTARVYAEGVKGGLLIDAADFDPEVYDIYDPELHEDEE